MEKKLEDKELFVAVHQPKEERNRANAGPYPGQFPRGFPTRGGFPGGRGGFMPPGRGGYGMPPGGNFMGQPSPYNMYRGAPNPRSAPMMMPGRPFQGNVPADFPRQGYQQRPMMPQMNRPMGMGGRQQMMPRQPQPVPRQVQQAPPQRSSQPAPQTASGPLTAQQLAQVDSKQQKQLIGERIFPQVQAIEPKLAGKITGMLLEMDNTELLHLLENQTTLMEKVNEALHILQQSARQAGVQ